LWLQCVLLLWPSGSPAKFTSRLTKTRITTIARNPILIILPIYIGSVTNPHLTDRLCDFLAPRSAGQINLLPQSGEQVVFDAVRDRHGTHDPVELLRSPPLPQHNRAEIR